MKSLKKTNDSYLCYIYNPSVSTEALEKMIALELGAEISPDKNTYQSIHERLLSIHQSGKKIILVLDEAQTMSDANLECIRLLTNLETEDSKLIQVIMFGQLEIKSRLKHHHLRQLKQRIFYHHELKPLSLPECSYYLKQRIRLSGGDPNTIIPSPTRRKIWNMSNGNPREINILAKRALLCAFSRDDQSVSIKDVKKAKIDIELEYNNKLSSRKLVPHILKSVILFVLFILAVLFVKRYL
jgi:MSHA biogenesis protein MshM